jgi:hypothetical protein
MPHTFTLPSTRIPVERLMAEHLNWNFCSKCWGECRGEPGAAPQPPNRCAPPLCARFSLSLSLSLSLCLSVSVSLSLFLPLPLSLSLSLSLPLPLPLSLPFSPQSERWRAEPWYWRFCSKCVGVNQGRPLNLPTDVRGSKHSLPRLRVRARLKSIIHIWRGGSRQK